MTILSLLKTLTNSPKSKEEYKKDVLRAVEILVSLGIMDTKSHDLNDSVESVIQKMKRDETILYGKELTREDILEELKQVNSEIEKLKQERLELDKQIALEELRIKTKEIDSIE